MKPARTVLLTLLVATPMGCFSLDYEPAGAGGNEPGASSGSSASVASGAVATTSSTSSAGGGSSSSGGAGGASVAGTGGSGGGAGTGGEGTGGAGGGGSGGAGGGICSPPGDGRTDVVTPWGLAIGPVRGPSGQPMGVVSSIMEGDRLVVGLASSGSEPVRIGDASGTEPVDGADQPGFLLAWVDDTNEFRDAWVLEKASLASGSGYPEIELAPGEPGHVLVAVIDAVSAFRVVDVDLCTRAERVIASCGGTTLQSAQIDGRLDGARAFSFNTTSGAPDCDVLPPGCALPDPIGRLDTVAWHIDASGACSSIAIHDPIEDLGAQDAYQTAGAIALGQGDDLLVVGNYDGALFTDDAPIQTGDFYYEDTNQVPAHPASVFHNYFAKLRPAGGDLEAVQAFDLGRLVNPGAHRAIAIGDDVVIAATVETGIQPGGPFSPPLNLTPQGGTDVLLARALPDGKTAWAMWTGSSSEDFLADLTRTASGMYLSVTTYSLDCASTGCATFFSLSDAGVPGALFAVQSSEDDSADVGVSGFALGFGDAFIVGTTTGTVDVNGVLAAPIVGSSNVYLARISE